MTAKDVGKKLIDTFKRGGKCLICGNGGSSSMASHFAGELMCKYSKERVPLPAVALNDPAVITAIGNDYGFAFVFRRQVEALGKKEDCLITLTTSGKSPNIIWAEDKAREIGMEVIRLPINNQWRGTSKTQETQLKMIHDICGIVEEAFV